MRGQLRQFGRRRRRRDGIEEIGVVDHAPSSRFSSACGIAPVNAPYVPGEGLDHVAFRVEDVDATVRALVARGLEVAPIGADLAEPEGDRSVSGWFKVAYVKDPDGCRGWSTATASPSR